MVKPKAKKTERDWERDYLDVIPRQVGPARTLATWAPKDETWKDESADGDEHTH
jgi:hypothetical protein